jgi:hypothetical protein
MVKTQHKAKNDPLDAPRDYQSCVNIIPGVGAEAAGKRAAFTFLSSDGTTGLLASDNTVNHRQLL